MRRETISLSSEDGEEELYGYCFGRGDKSACMIGGLEEDEYQQRYAGVSLIQILKELEERGAIVNHNEIMVIPSAGKNPAALLDRVKEYGYGIRFCGSKKGVFVPHVRMEESERQNASLGNLFGLPFVAAGSSVSWESEGQSREWDRAVFSVYIGESGKIQEEAVNQGISAVLRFLTRMGILRYTSHSGYLATVVTERDMTGVCCDSTGIYRPLFQPGDEVRRGEVLAKVLSPETGEVISQIQSPTGGILFYAHTLPMVKEGEWVYEIIRRLHR